MNVSLLPQSLDEPREDGVLRKGAGEQDLPFTYSGTNVTQESVGTLIAIQRNLPDEVGGWVVTQFRRFETRRGQPTTVVPHAQQLHMHDGSIQVGSRL